MDEERVTQEEHDMIMKMARDSVAATLWWRINEVARVGRVVCWVLMLVFWLTELPDRIGDTFAAAMLVLWLSDYISLSQARSRVEMVNEASKYHQLARLRGE